MQQKKFPPTGGVRLQRVVAGRGFCLRQTPAIWRNPFLHLPQGRNRTSHCLIFDVSNNTPFEVSALELNILSVKRMMHFCKGNSMLAAFMM
jgi:hypothetical protein